MCLLFFIFSQTSVLSFNEYLEWKTDILSPKCFFSFCIIWVVKEISGEKWEVGSIERQSFYEESKKSYAIVTTTDLRPFGCFIITKGVIKPDGSVWVLDK